MSHWYIRLRNALKDAGYTFEDVAAHIGVSRSAVGHYLRGTREPSVAQIKKMCALAGKSMSEIVGDDALFVQRPEERQVVETFRGMTDEQKRAVLMLMQQMAKPG